MHVRRNDEAERYEVVDCEDVLGFADFRRQGDVVVMPHTVMDGSRRGEGLGDVLVAGALDDVRAAGATVEPACWFVRDFIDRHPEYGDLVAG